MINNSSIQKWDRLKKKTIDSQFINLVEQGLNCSPFEASALLDVVYKVYGIYFEISGAIKPGQMLIEAVSVNEPPGKLLSKCSFISVTITLDDGEEDLKIREEAGVIGLRQHRLIRICNEVFQQGGLLTVEDIANRLLNCGERTICRDIKDLKDKGVVLPLRSTIKDIGRSLSHRVLIVKEWLLGNEYSQIARKTNHSVDAVRNYINKFKRVICLADENYEHNTIAFLIKLSPGLVEEYYKIYKELNIVRHRKKELDELLKKKM